MLRWWREFTRWLRSHIALFDAVAAHPVGSGLAWVAGWALTLTFVALGWVLFALPLPQAANVFMRLFGLPPSSAAFALPTLKWW